MISSRAKKSLVGIVGILLVLVITGATLTAQVSGNLEGASFLEPPYYSYLPAAAKGQTEWTFHKTADGLHPDGNEQQMVWLMNRARANPTQEGIWLATTTEYDVAGPRDYFHVNVNLLKSEFASYAAKPPAAFDVRLYNAARVHSEDLIARDAQDHTNQFKRVTDAGYVFAMLRGCVFSYSRSSLNAHGGFNIDWGGNANDGDATDDGMQYTRGHRKAIMSLDGDYSNVGIAIVADNNPDNNVGPLVTTGNYGKPNLTAANHYNRFVVGTVWQDRNGNSLYDPGEGYGNVTVSVYPGNFNAVTAFAGGYAVPILAPGTYTVTFSGAVQGQQQVVVGTTSVLVDLKIPTGLAAPDEIPSQPSGPARPPVAPPPAISE